MAKLVKLVKTYVLKTWVDLEELAEAMEMPVNALSDDDIINEAQEQVADWIGREARYPEAYAIVKVEAVYTDHAEVS